MNAIETPKPEVFEIFQCEACGSENLCFDGAIRWDARTQRYKVDGTHDLCSCNECDADEMYVSDCARIVAEIVMTFDRYRQDMWFARIKTEHDNENTYRHTFEGRTYSNALKQARNWINQNRKEGGFL